MALDNSTAQYVFKTLYSDGFDPKSLVRKKPLLQWCEHKTDFTSARGMEIPAPYVNPQGIGATNAAASSNEVSGKGVTFLLPQRSVYGFGAINGSVVRNAVNGNDDSQFINAMEREVDGATESIAVELHQRMYGTNTGIRAYLSGTAAITTTTWTFANVEDVQFFEPGMKVVLVNPATGAARVGSAVTVTSVDPDAGTMVCSGNPNSFTSAAAGDGIARDSMVGADLDGLSAWCPTTVSGSDSFLGVNRSVYRSRLAGVYSDISNDPIRSGFIKAIAKAEQQVGTMFDADSPFFIHPKNLAQIMQSVEQAKIVHQELDDKFGIGLKAVKIMDWTFVRDAMCPVNTAYLVGEDAFIRASCGSQPKLDDSGGNEFFMNFRTGVLEFVLVHDGNCGSPAPYNILRCSLPTTAL